MKTDPLYMVIDHSTTGVYIRGIYENYPSYVSSVNINPKNKSTSILKIPVNKSIEKLIARG